jgi:signal transduction histidine kinase
VLDALALRSRVARSLPRVVTPETVAGFVRAALRDPSAELLYRPVDGDVLLDASGHRREPDLVGRRAVWISGTDGRPVALLTTCAAPRELVRVLAPMVESARLSVLLRTRIARSTAVRIAQEVAFSLSRQQFRRDLHDGLQQTLAAARMDLDGLPEATVEEATAVVRGLEAKLTTALAQLHTLDRGTPALSLTALEPAIAAVIDELGLPGTVTVSGTPPALLSLPVFQLVREALTNAHKHAGAGAVEVRVRCDDCTVEVVVVDDGCGGGTEPPSRALATLRRRVEKLGGTLTLDSPPDLGTTLRASIPCV